MATTPPAVSTLAAPPYRTAIVGASGIVSSQWQMWFQSVTLRIGGASSDTLTSVIASITTINGEITDLQTLTAAINAAVAGLQATVTSQGAQIAANTSELVTHDGEITTLQAVKAPIDTPIFTGTVTQPRPSVITAATTVTSATAGAASALPSVPLGYLVMSINGATVKVPYYA